MKVRYQVISILFLGFSSLTLCNPLFAAGPAVSDQLKELIKNCGICHGVDGNSPNPTIPSVAGITAEYFKHTMDAYKNDGRKSVLMKGFVHSLSDAELDMIANYYAQQTYVAREQTYDPALAAAGEKLHYKYCEKCHENGGRITDNNYGVLAGQWIPYLKKALQDYLDENRRVNPMMITKLKSLKNDAGEEGIDQIVHYYASLK